MVDSQHSNKQNLAKSCGFLFTFMDIQLLTNCSRSKNELALIHLTNSKYYLYSSAIMLMVQF